MPTMPMPPMKRLDATALQSLPELLPDWQFDRQRGGTLTRTFEFRDFVEAFGFMTELALESERRNHHPEWSNVYQRVTITWTSHDVDGLSDLDLEMARLADRCHAVRAAARAAGAA